MHKIIAKNTFYQTLARIFSSGTGLVITIILARYFGIFGYGDYIKITSFVALFYLPVDFGLNAIFLKEDQDLVEFKSLFYFRILMALGIFILANLAAFILPFNSFLQIGFSPSVKMGIFIFSFSLFAQAIILTVSAVFQKTHSYSRYAISVIVGSLINLIFIITVILLKGTIYQVILSFLISNFITAIVALFLVKRRILPFSLNASFTKKIILSSLPLGIMLVFNLVYFRIDSIILSFLKTSKDVGIYGFSYKFFDFLIALPLFLSNSLYPFLLENKKNTRIFFNLIKNYIFIFALTGVFLIIPFLLLSPLFTLIKKDFYLSILPFNILLFSLPIFFVTSLLQWSLITLGKQKFLLYIYLISAIINVALNLIFIPSFSYLASAVITGVTELLVIVILAIKLFGLKIILEREL